MQNLLSLDGRKLLRAAVFAAVFIAALQMPLAAQCTYTISPCQRHRCSRGRRGIVYGFHPGGLYLDRRGQCGLADRFPGYRHCGELRLSRQSQSLITLWHNHVTGREFQPGGNVYPQPDRRNLLVHPFRHQRQLQFQRRNGSLGFRDHRVQLGRDGRRELGHRHQRRRQRQRNGHLYGGAERLDQRQKRHHHRRNPDLHHYPECRLRPYADAPPARVSLTPADLGPSPYRQPQPVATAARYPPIPTGSPSPSARPGPATGL